MKITTEVTYDTLTGIFTADPDTITYADETAQDDPDYAASRVYTNLTVLLPMLPGVDGI